MSNQKRIRRRIATLEAQQRERRIRWDEQQLDMNTLLEEKDREIANLKAQVTIDAAR